MKIKPVPLIVVGKEILYIDSKEVRKMLAKKTSKNQITLPKDIVKNFPDTIYFEVSMDNNRILLKPVKILPQENNLEKVRLKMKKLGITEKDVEGAIAWARKNTG
jgi:hypothetical protein